MNTLISATGNTLDSPFELRFGRAAWFCLLNEETGETSFYENDKKETTHGHGTKAVELAVKLSVSKVISGDFGAKSRELLEKYDIQMVILTDDLRSIADIIDRIK